MSGVDTKFNPGIYEFILLAGNIWDAFFLLTGLYVALFLAGDNRMHFLNNRVIYCTLFYLHRTYGMHFYYNR